MKEYVLDANAVLRYFGVGEGKGAEKVRALFVMVERGQARTSMSAINLGEVFYVLLRRVDEAEAVHILQPLLPAVEIVDAGLDQAITAAKLKHQYKLGYADSFAASLALSRNATLVSADPSFERIRGSVQWMRLPRFLSSK